MGHRFFTVTAVVLLAAVILTIGGLGALHLPPIQAAAWNYARDYVERSYGVTLNASRVRYNLFRLAFTFEDLTVAAADRPEMPPILTAARFSVDVGLLQLPGGVIHLEEVAAEDLDVQLEFDETGAGNLPALGGADAAPAEGGPSVRIAALEIAGARLSYLDRRRGLRIELPAWRLGVAGVDDAHRIEFAAAPGGRVETADFALDLAAMEGTVLAAPDALEVESLRLDSSLGTLSAAGSLVDFSAPAIDARAEVDLDAAGLAAMAGPEARVEGRLRTEARVHTDAGALAVEAETRGAGLTVEDFGPVELDATWSWTAEPGRIVIEALSVGWRNGVLNATGDLSLVETGSSRLEVEAARLDLESLTRILDAPVRLASLASGRMAASWPGLAWRTATAEGRIALDATRPATAPGLLPVSARLNLGSAGESVSVEVISLAAAGIEARGRAGLVSGRLNGAIEALAPDAAGAIAAIRRLAGAADAAEEEPLLPRGAVAISARLDGAVENPRVAFDLDAPALSLGDLENLALHAEGVYTPQRIELAPASIGWNGETLVIQGALDTSVDPAALAFEVDGPGLPLRAIGAALALDTPVEGVVNLAASVRGAIEAPVGEIRLAGEDLAVGAEPLGRFDVRIELDPDRAHLAEMVWVRSPDAPAAGTITGEGDYVYDTGRFTFALAGDRIDAADFGFLHTRGVEGRAEFAITGEGTPEAPELEFRFSVQDAAYGGAPLGEVTLNGAFAGERLEAALAAPRHDFTAEAELATTAPYPGRIRAAVRGLELEAFQPLVPEDRPLRGRIGAVAEASGALENWRDGSARLELNEFQTVIQGQELAIDGGATLTYESRRIRIEPLVVTAGGERLEIEGDLPLEAGAPEGAIRIGGRLDLASILAMATAEPPVEAAGLLNLEIGLTGSLARIEPRLEARLENASLGLPDSPALVTDLQAAFRSVENRLMLESLDARWGETGTIRATGGVALAALSDVFPAAAGAAATLELQVTDLALRSIPGAPAGVDGRVSLTLGAEAERFALEAVDARLQFDRLEVTMDDLGLTQPAPAVITLADGQARIEQFSLAGQETTIAVFGEVGLTGDRVIRLDVAADTTAGLVTILADAVQASGRIGLDLAVRGTLEEPTASGDIELTDAAFGLESPEVQADAVQARLRLTEETITLETLTGNLNGGVIEAQGVIRHEGLTLADVQLDVAAREVFLEVPQGLQTLSTTEIRVRSENDLLPVTGSVQVLEGSYTRNLTLNALIADYFSGAGGAGLAAEENPLLARIRYDVGIETVQPIIVDNNLAQLQAEADLDLVGAYYSPGLIGRVVIAEGGAVELQETQFLVQRGIIDFTNPAAIEPSLDFVANATVARYDVTLQVAGANMETTLTSDPGLPEPDIIALLLTGRTLQDVRDAGFNVAREQALSYLAGTLGGQISAGAEQALGLSRVRIEPNLIANESNPGARLTVGQNLTRDLELIYSMNLTDSNDQIWIAEYDVTRRFLTRAIKQEDNSYRFELRHDLDFGLPPPAEGPAAAGAARVLQDIAMSPESFADRSLRAVLDLEVGRSYNFLDIRRAAQRLEEFFFQRDHLEARVRIRRLERNDGVRLDVAVEPGPQVGFEFLGADLPRGVTEAVRDAWRRAGFDLLRSRNAVREIRRRLIEDGYVQARAEADVRSDEGVKYVVFRIDPGPQYRRVEVDFDGVTAFAAETLRDALRNADLWFVLPTAPGEARTFLEERYRAAGYLDVAVGAPRAEFDPTPGVARFTIPVEEGPLHHIQVVRLEGNENIGPAVLLEGLTLEGAAYTPERAQTAAARIREVYWNRGYSRAEVRRSAVRLAEPGAVALTFEITENMQDVVRDIRITGNLKTSEDLVRSQLAIEPGRPLDFSAINRSRQNLYQTGAYSLVSIESTPLEETASIPVAPGENAVRLDLTLRETPPFSLRYGGFYDTERGPGAIVDLTNRNSLGRARVAGLRGRYDSGFREARIYFSQPPLLGLPVSTHISGFINQEIDGSAENELVTERLGFLVQQEAQLANRFVLNYGYRFERPRNYARNPERAQLFPPLLVLQNVARITASLTRDTRDDLLDASRGSFTSHALEYAAGPLGSDLSMVRYFGQIFRYVPLSPPREIPYSDGVMKPRFVYAAGLRLGAAVGLGGDIVPRHERFFLGGGTSVRGFQQDMVGPIVPLFEELRPQGGDMMIAINNELRFPLYHIFDGVAFLDAGNVYRRVDEFDPFHLRAGAGVGLRARTPWFLLRADYGFKLNRKPGETPGGFFFSIGQAF